MKARFVLGLQKEAGVEGDAQLCDDLKFLKARSTKRLPFLVRTRADTAQQSSKSQHQADGLLSTHRRNRSAVLSRVESRRG